MIIYSCFSYFGDFGDINGLEGGYSILISSYVYQTAVLGQI